MIARWHPPGIRSKSRAKKKTLFNFSWVEPMTRVYQFLIFFAYTAPLRKQKNNPIPWKEVKVKKKQENKLGSPESPWYASYLALNKKTFVLHLEIGSY